MPEPITVQHLLEQLAFVPPETKVLVCPEEPHVACHLVIEVEDYDPGDPYLTLGTLDQGPTAEGRRHERSAVVRALQRWRRDIIVAAATPGLWTDEEAARQRADLEAIEGELTRFVGGFEALVDMAGIDHHAAQARLNFQGRRYPLDRDAVGPLPT